MHVHAHAHTCTHVKCNESFILKLGPWPAIEYICVYTYKGTHTKPLLMTLSHEALC